ncbi:hypothetical protein DPSP01_011879 [Paraphaeosphaeria sporulosa]
MQQHFPNFRLALSNPTRLVHTYTLARCSPRLHLQAFFALRVSFVRCMHHTLSFTLCDRSLLQYPTPIAVSNPTSLRLVYTPPALLDTFSSLVQLHFQPSFLFVVA